MKKLRVSLAGGLFLTLAGMLWNYLNFRKNHWLKFAYSGHGGEITIQYGFGWRLVHIFAMEMGQSDSISLKFDPFSFLFCFLLCTASVFLAVTIMGRIVKK